MKETCCNADICSTCRGVKIMELAVLEPKKDCNDAEDTDIKEGAKQYKVNGNSCSVNYL